MKDSDRYFVQQLIGRFQIEFKRNDRSGVYAYTQRLMAYNSNKIEGSTLTEKQTASLFDTGLLSGEDAPIRAKDVEEMTGHFLMFNEMLKTYDQPLSHKLIKEYHFKLKSGVFEDIANGYPIGEYKSRRNIVSNITTALPEDVPQRMTNLLQRYNAIRSPALMDLVKLHVEYETIHPFQDGNGRTGRIILFKECLKNGIVPFIISDARKQEYYSALNRAQTDCCYDLLHSFFISEQKAYKELMCGFVLPIDIMSMSEAEKEAADRLRRATHDSAEGHRW